MVKGRKNQSTIVSESMDCEKGSSRERDLSSQIVAHGARFPR